MRLLTTAAVTFGLASVAFAGGYMNNTNQSIDFVRNFAQGASTSPSGAVYWNPAGVAFADNGLYVSAHTQTIWQTRNIDAQFFGEYEGESFVPAMPSATVAYKHNDWSVFGSFFISGGGGSVEFDDGVPMLDALVGPTVYGTLSGMGAQLGMDEATIGGMLKMNGLLAPEATFSYKDLYETKTYFKGSSTIYAGLLGGSYKVTDILSLAIGVRFNYAKNAYKVSYEVNPTQTAKMLDGAAAQAGMQLGLSEQLDLDETLLKVEQDGFGFTPVIGMHLHFKKVDVGVKYEGETNIEMKNDTKTIHPMVSSFMPQYEDGVKDDGDLPAQISIGGRIKWLDWLRTSIGYAHYFDQAAEYANDVERTLHHDEKEFFGGIEVDPIKMLTLSVGIMRTEIGYSDKSLSDLDFGTPSTSIGGGFAVRLTDWVAFQVGYMETLYDTYHKVDEMTGTKRSYDRSSHNVGAGLDFKF